MPWKSLGAPTARARRLNGLKRLWLVQTNEHPAEPLAFLGQNTFVVRSASLDEFTGNYSHFRAEYKYPAGLNASQGVLVKMVTAHRAHARIKHSKLGETKGHVPGPLSREDVHELAESENVLWISPYREHKRHALASRSVLMGGTIAASTTLQQGTGTILLVTDTGLDTAHCMFYDGHGVPVSPLYHSGALPTFAGAGKVLGVMPFEYAPGVFTDPTPYADAHGTSTAGVAAGYACAGNEGVAPGTRFLFMDLSYAADSLVTPRSWHRAFSVAAAHGVSVHTASWGSTLADGVYDGQAHEFDEYAREFDLLHVVSAGNDGPYLVASPATAKNCISVGASMSTAADFIHFDADERADAPLLFDLTTGANFTSQGPTLGGRRAPLVFAPGVAVQVAYALAAGTPGHDEYVYESGTSFAAPAVAGAALAIDEFFLNATGVRASAAMKMAALIVGNRPIARFVGVGTTTVTLSPSTPADISYGVPLLHVDDTLMLDRMQTTGDRAAYCFTATATTVSVALAWLDVAILPGVYPELVNDLDLVVSVNGTEQTLNNHLDNTESLTVAAEVGMAVRVVVSVLGLVSSGAQNYSLALVGASPSGAPCGTCLSSDRTGCAVGELPVCDDATGVSACAVEACPDGQVYNGTGCSDGGSTPCDIDHGSGLLVSAVCLVQHCDANYVASADGTACTCLDSVECGDVIVFCKDNAFISCSDAHAQAFPAGVAAPRTATRSSASALLWWGAATALLALSLGALLYLCCAWVVEDAKAVGGLRRQKIL